MGTEPATAFDRVGGEKSDRLKDEAEPAAATATATAEAYLPVAEEQKE